MSSKINVFGVVKGHINTLIDQSTGERSKVDLIVFFALPLLLGIASAVFGFPWRQGHADLLITAGSLLTGLLLSLLVLVYDQHSKLVGIKPADLAESAWADRVIRKEVLRQLYFNISYATIASLTLVILAFALYSLAEKSFLINLWKIGKVSIWFDRDLIGPLIAFVSSNLVLTVAMIIKRINGLLSSDS